MPTADVYVSAAANGTLALAGVEDQQRPGDISYIFTSWSLVLETFVGLVLAPGLGLVDTGAQHGVCGPTAWRQVVEVLKNFS